MNDDVALSEKAAHAAAHPKPTVGSRLAAIAGLCSVGMTIASAAPRKWH